VVVVVVVVVVVWSVYGCFGRLITALEQVIIQVTTLITTQLACNYPATQQFNNYARTR